MARSGSNKSEGRIGLLLMIVLSAVLLFTQRDAATERRSTPLLASDIQAPVAVWLSAPFRHLEGAVADVEGGRRALQENKALRDELTSLRVDNARLQAQQARLQRLEKLLAVDRTGDIPDYRISARAVSDPSGPFVRSLLIASGRENGVEEGYAVLSDAGLVGHVVSAGQRSARVLRLDDLNSRVAVISERSGARAILAGANNDRPMLAFVADQDDWQVGDRVLTSGDDGRLPEGLPIGTVLPGDRLAVELDFLATPIDWVFVLPYSQLADPSDVDIALDPSADDNGDTASATTEEAN
ncbi:rod shape-determining protein MreC [Algimonas arctica]|nr:rod shape-determining protein MreC [Algimonas arctica]